MTSLTDLLLDASTVQTLSTNQQLNSCRKKFDDTKGAFRIRISKKNRQHNRQKKKYKQQSTKHTYKT
jgi:hypothetical protein